MRKDLRKFLYFIAGLKMLTGSLDIASGLARDVDDETAEVATLKIENGKKVSLYEMESYDQSNEANKSYTSGAISIVFGLSLAALAFQDASRDQRKKTPTNQIKPKKTMQLKQ